MKKLLAIVISMAMLVAMMPAGGGCLRKPT